MKRLLFIGDAGCPSGFAKASHATLDVLRKSFDITVLAMNYRGDPTGYPDFLQGRIWAAFAGGDAFGIGRLIWMCDLVKPDVIVVQQDGWNLPFYIKELKSKTRNYDGKYANVPVIAACAVDGKNFQGEWLNGVSLAIFWTEFALSEARLGGYNGPAAVVPLGVDLDLYKPGDKIEARRRKLPAEFDDKFIVGNVNRNQPRKRLDLTIKFFAEWIKTKRIDDAYLYLHVAPTGDMGFNVRQLMAYYGILDRLLLAEPETWYGDTEEQMVATYNSFDVQISTTQGEGFGLTTFEGMACGIPQIVPDWASLGELCQDAAMLVPCSTTAVGPPYVNVIGGVVDEGVFVNALDAVYNNRHDVSAMQQRGFDRVAEPRFRWANVGRAFTDAVSWLLKVKDLEVKDSDKAGQALGAMENSAQVSPEQANCSPLLTSPGVMEVALAESREEVRA